MDYYGSVVYIDEIDAKIKQKENELLMLKFMNVNNINHNITMRNIESEIDELKMQRTYHSNWIADQMMKGCIGGCCRRNNAFY